MELHSRPSLEIFKKRNSRSFRARFKCSLLVNLGGGIMPPLNGSIYLSDTNTDINSSENSQYSVHELCFTECMALYLWQLGVNEYFVVKSNYPWGFLFFLCFFLWGGGGG